MTKTKWTLVLLGIFNLVLFIVHLTDFSFLFLTPTGYIIPIIINMIVLAVLGFLSQFRSVWVFTGLFLSMPILLVHSFMVFMSDNSYTTIHSPHGQQSLFIEYRDFTLGETTYFYNFYETRFGFVGRYLDDQSMRIMDRNFPPGIDAKDVLGLHDVEWITDEMVRLPTWDGMEEIELESSPATTVPSQPTAYEGDMGSFIDAVENEEDGETITIHGNILETRYDENTGQSWIDVSDNEGEGAIPTQQCSRVEKDDKSGYYMLVECTHQWEYRLQSLDSEQ